MLKLNHPVLLNGKKRRHPLIMILKILKICRHTIEYHSIHGGFISRIIL
jgi:hypothetical protein